MIWNYIKTALRNFSRNALYTGINLFGLAIGIASVLFIGVYFRQQLGFDRFQENRDVLYRVGFEAFKEGKSTGNGPQYVAAFAPDAKAEFPEIEAFCRFSPDHAAYFEAGDKKIKAAHVAFADSTFFRMFTFSLASGNPETALQKPYSLVLTQPLAQKLFGAEPAVGKTVLLDGEKPYLVTGVCPEPPANSQIRFEAITSLSTLYQEPEKYYMDWNGGNMYITYLQVYPQSDPAALQAKLPDFMWEHVNREYAKIGYKNVATLQPFAGVHLYYQENSLKTRTNLYVLGTVALLILLVSGVNFVNLTTAQAFSRFREVGVRKVMGASRTQLITQFLGESVLLTLAGYVLALLLFYLLLPVFENILGGAFSLTVSSALFLLLLGSFLLLVVGVGAGGYLAFYLSSLNVEQTLKGGAGTPRRNRLRTGLIVFQFAVTMAIMTFTLIVSLQLRFVKDRSPGYDKEHIVILPLAGSTTGKQADVLKQQILVLSGVVSVTAVSEVPYNGVTRNGFFPQDEAQPMMIHQLDADDQLLGTFRLELLQGEYFSKDKPTTSEGYVINEQLAKTLGWDNPVGKTLNRNGAHPVIGVVKDFVFASLYDHIGPLIITNQPDRGRFNFLAVRYGSAAPAGLIGELNAIWDRSEAGSPFEYWFLDEAFDAIYRDETHFQTLFIAFAIISILLSLAGTVGLVSLTIQQRFKEIGIRKVLGAGLKDIVLLTSGRYAAFILVAALFALPLAWYYSVQWLEDFAYRISLQGWMFLVSGLIIMIITGVITGIQSLKPALSNPVKSLRTE